MAVDRSVCGCKHGSECGYGVRKLRLPNTSVNSFCTLVLFCAVFVCATIAADTSECSAVRLGFQTRAINGSDLLAEPRNGQHLKVCPILERTCCSEATETRLQANSKQQFEKTVKDAVVKLSAVLNTRSQRFDVFFQEMLATSKREFHEMFKKTYGVIYEQNAYVFTDFFEELEKYYTRGQVDLAEAMDHFFSVLYQRMFTVINSQYHFDDKYLSCVADHMKDLKPFGDVPQKLSIQIKRSFVAARTFARALSVGADVSKSMLSIKPTQECTKSLLRMQHCAGCAGYPQARACSNYCINVMKGCLAYHASLETEWNNYVDAMDKICDRLLGSFNIEMVVEPIDIKISEAIMNFQENGPDVSQRVFTGCGKPVLGRRRRRAARMAPGKEYHENLLRIKYQRSQDQDLEFEGAEVLERNAVVRRARATNKELTFETLSFNKNTAGEDATKKPGKVAHHVKQEGPSLEKLVKDIRHIVKESKRFWSHLPYQICNNEELAEGPSKDEECWNGTTISKYLPTVVGDGLGSQKNNPDVYVDVNRQNSVLNEQIYALKTIANKIMNAYQGMDVEWIDTEESSSSYISGSGSGDTEPDEDDGYIDQEGSGDDRNNPFAAHEPPVFPPDMPDVLTPNITASEIPESSGSQMTLARALITYLFPLILIWFGGLFSSELL